MAQTADFGPKTALKVVDAIRDDIRSGRVKTRSNVRYVLPPCTARLQLQPVFAISSTMFYFVTVLRCVCVSCRSRLKQSIVDVLNASGRSSDLQFPASKPAVLLIVGVNGGGKTTTIGKLAYKYGSEGVKVGQNCSSLPAPQNTHDLRNCW